MPLWLVRWRLKWLWLLNSRSRGCWIQDHQHEYNVKSQLLADWLHYPASEKDLHESTVFFLNLQSVDCTIKRSIPAHPPYFQHHCISAIVGRSLTHTSASTFHHSLSLWSVFASGRSGLLAHTIEFHCVHALTLAVMSTTLSHLSPCFLQNVSLERPSSMLWA